MQGYFNWCYRRLKIVMVCSRAVVWPLLHTGCTQIGHTDAALTQVIPRHITYGLLKDVEDAGSELADASTIRGSGSPEFQIYDMHSCGGRPALAAPYLLSGYPKRTETSRPSALTVPRISRLQRILSTEPGDERWSGLRTERRCHRIMNSEG